MIERVRPVPTQLIMHMIGYTDITTEQRNGGRVQQDRGRGGQRLVMVMVMIMVINLAYTGPRPRYFWCSSSSVLRSRSAERSMFGAWTMVG